jgi:HAD superfamily hydrolase (TIGR01509 family)
MLSNQYFSERIPKNIKAVIFDFDGVIVDTEEIGANVAMELIDTKFGIKLTSEDKKRFYGIFDEDYYEIILTKYDLTADLDELMNEHNSVYDKFLEEMNALLPGAEEVIKKLKNMGFKLAICSGSYSHQLELILNAFNLKKYFEIVVSCEDTKKHKPDPEPYLITASKFGIDPKDCLVLEDADMGVNSAKTAGMYCIGVKIGNHNTQNLKQADLVIETLKELI